MIHKGWTVRWELAKTGIQAGFPSYQVFTSPEGVEYVRTRDPALAAVTISDFATPGLGPLYLKPLSRSFPATKLLSGEGGAAADADSGAPSLS